MQKFFIAHSPKELAGWVALALLAIFTFVSIYFGPQNPQFAPATAHASGNAITGYAWSDTVGWISFSGTAADSSPYGVTVGAGGALSGYAWSDNAGWISFNANTCGAQATMAAGALSGFAQAVGADNKGWDGCISLSGASPAYGPTLSGTTFTGYAWGSDVMGWLSFSGTAADGSPYAVVYGGTGGPTCTLSVSPNPAGTGSSVNLNYTTANSPTTGTIKDASGTTLTSSATSPSGTISATAPSSPGSYAYTMNVANLSGSGSCSTSPALSAQNDVCQDIAGLQTTEPSSCTGTPPLCVQNGYSPNGSGDTATCVPNVATINSFSGPARVRSGSTAVLAYTIATPPSSCTITGTNGFSTTINPVSGVPGTVTTTAITYATDFTLTCGSVTSSASVGLIPVYQEL